MPSQLENLDEHIKAFAGHRTEYAVMGTCLLYLMGYLTLRFHLTAMGIATDLAVLDERYLFTGARFIVYLLSLLPTIVFIALPPTVIAWAVWHSIPSRLRARVHDWRPGAGALTVIGILFSVVMIEYVFRRCFVFSDMLLTEHLPTEPVLLVALLYNDKFMPGYFSLLAASCLVSAAFLWPLFGSTNPSPALVRGRALLALLLAVQVLFLPINYGTLIVDKSLPRVAAVGTRQALPGETAWLVWEGKETATFLLRSADGQRRSLVTVPRAQTQQIEVLAFERIIPKLFDAAGAPRFSSPTPKQ